MVLSQGGYANAYLSGIRHGGAYEMTSLCWLLTRSINSKEASDNPILRKALELIPLEGYLDPRRGQVKEGITPFSFFPDYEKVFFDTLLHSKYDEYWKTPWHSAELFYDGFADVPILIETGWYDHYTLNDCMLYTDLSQRKKGPIQLIVGPWTHGGTMLTYSGEVEFGPQAPLDASIAPNYNTLILRWFDHWLKAIDNGVENDPTVRIFVMGGGSGTRRYRFMQHGGKWRNEKDWPLPNTTYTKYYFHEDGGLALDLPQRGNHILAIHLIREILFLLLAATDIHTICLVEMTGLNLKGPSIKWKGQTFLDVKLHMFL
jgi:putative CocE/NonD family hydrolase